MNEQNYGVQLYIYIQDTYVSVPEVFNGYRHVYRPLKYAHVRSNKLLASNIKC